MLCRLKPTIDVVALLQRLNQYVQARYTTQSITSYGPRTKIIVSPALNRPLALFDWVVVAKGLISTIRGSQPIAERAVCLGNHSFLHHTKQVGMQMFSKKRYMACERLQTFPCAGIHARSCSSHMPTHQQIIRGSVAVDGDLSLWHQTSCRFILRRWTCEPWSLLMFTACVWKCISVCTFQSKGMETTPQVRRRMQSHCCGITRSLLFYSSWSTWLQVLWEMQ